MSANNIKGFFVCNRCRETCKDGLDDVGPYGPNSCVKAYYPRKQYIKCLGSYCDSPCGFREKISDVTVEQLINLVKFLTIELNKHLIIKK